MLKDLNIEELVQIEGGTKEDPCYEFGNKIGKVCAAVLAANGFFRMFL